MAQFTDDFEAVAAEAAQDSGLVGGVLDHNGRVYFVPFIAGKVVGHQNAIQQGLLPEKPTYAFSVFVDSNGRPTGIHWKSIYNSADTDFVPSPDLRQQIIDSIPNKSLDFFQSGLE